MARKPRRSRSSSHERVAMDAAAHIMRTEGGRRALFVLLIVALLAYGGWWLWENHLRPREPVGPTVRVATWNLHKSGRDTFDPRLAAQIIRDGKFDVVALQEVTREDPNRTLSNDGDNVERLVRELGSPWKLADVSPVSGNAEAFAFIYHGDRVQLVSAPHFVALIETREFDRWPYQATFRAGNFDFTLITAHLYYGQGRPEDYAKRSREAQTLASMAAEVAARSNEKDVIVLGDFNEERGRANFGHFAAAGWEPTVDAPTNLSGTEEYDDILVHAGATREYAGTSGAVTFDATHFPGDRERARSTVSDHRPAWADFKTGLPDDD